MTINNAFELLESYSGSFKLTLHPGANETLINKVECTYGITLPDDFKTLYRFTDGFEIDEDIFNMIPLGEMISNKMKDKSIWVAEYMIYSEMWGLEINPEIPNQYSISIADSDSEKITLTNSLAEFIGRILKGGCLRRADCTIGKMK
ncbi:SMI1/KNR4 family protein [Mucilaginibacter flavidus]|uniref:SMI1/KNR4 family protein n=1 Tax=Mucilaginibacter flavidus TaxID=2949309 RepID=UPI002093158C|nr:SMI1/KNR4 family protein [Mucilaginibacter flavidus]MCO5946371.1 SMI1/KNR4 family protein [Mucilaginibacter flavidus]